MCLEKVEAKVLVFIYVDKNNFKPKLHRSFVIAFLHMYLEVNCKL